MEETAQERFERYKKMLMKIIYRRIPDCTVYLYGSRARGNYREG